MEVTGERFIPEYPGDWSPEHYHRYFLALGLVRGKRVLDIASGEGYGSAILAQRAKHVTGVDISAEAVESARSKYHLDNLEYRCGSVTAIPLSDHSVDVVVSFETIEHLSEQEEMLAEISRVLKQNGVLMISSPDKKTYSDIPGYHNEFHVKELYEKEFVDLLQRFFPHINLYRQNLEYGSVISSEAENRFVYVEQDGNSFLPHDGLPQGKYIIAVAGRETLPEVPNSLLNYPVETSEAVAIRQQHVERQQKELEFQDARNKQLCAYVEEEKVKNEILLQKLHKAYEDISAEQKNNVKLISDNEDLAQKLHDAYDEIQSEQENNIKIVHHNETLSESLREKQIELEEVHMDKEQLRAQLNTILNSRSWRFTAPLRAIGHSLFGQQCGIVSRILIALLLFPASLAVSSSLRNWLQRMTDGKDFMGGLLDAPHRVSERVSASPRIVQLLVCLPLNAALTIHKKDGIAPTCRSLLRIVRNEGVSGVCHRFFKRVPASPANYCGTDPSQANAAAKNYAKSVLVVDYRIPKHDVSAGERATWGILLDLKALGYDVSFMPSNMYYDADYADQLKKKGITVVTSCEGCYTPNDFIARHGAEFGLFYLIRVDVAEEILYTIRQASPESKVFFHAPDIYFLRESREAELLHDEQRLGQAMKTKERELELMRRVNFTVVISENERKLLKEYLPETPMGVFPGLYAPIVEEPAAFADRKDIFFLGGFAHRPNVDAVFWFTKEIWPLIHARLPEVSFHIVGSEATEEINALGDLPGVVVDGFVKELEPFLNSIRLGVAPLRFGAGIKGKVAMTFGAGVPCVCTEIAAEGMELKNGVHTFIEDEPEAFAEAVVKSYTDEAVWNKMSVESKEQVRRLFSEEANRRRLTTLLWEQDALPVSLWADYCTRLFPRPLPAMREDTDVSIIIPVYNKWHLTRACINSILETCDGGISYEIILADDGSKDETDRGGFIFPGVRVEKTPQNMGFLRNCNNAAQQARGRHILLLNNDTIVFPNWLYSLYELMESDERAGLVGSKLIYPSGEIQEAGGVIWNDASALNYGHGDPYNRCGHCSFVREADYISGASILIRGSLWRELGGFDQRYKTAYCEDCDLAMEVRAHGLRVLYQPDSTIIHFEHQSYADADATMQSELQKINSHILYEKWKDVLTRDHMPPETVSHINICHACRSVLPYMLERRRDGHVRILFMSPYPLKMNAERHTTLLNDLKSQGHHIHYALLDSGLHGEADRAELRATWPCDMIYPYHQLSTEKDILAVSSWLKPDTGKQVLSICGERKADMILCPYLFQAEMLRYIPNNLLKIIDLRGQDVAMTEQDIKRMRLADLLIVDGGEEARINKALNKDVAVVLDEGLEKLLSHPKLISSAQ